MHCKTRENWPFSGLVFRFSGYFFNLWRLSPKSNPKRFLGYLWNSERNGLGEFGVQYFGLFPWRSSCSPTKKAVRGTLALKVFSTIQRAYRHWFSLQCPRFPLRGHWFFLRGHPFPFRASLTSLKTVTSLNKEARPLKFHFS